MKNHKVLFLSAVALIAVTATVNAAPLPNGTLLPITQGNGGAPNTVCTGSCFGMEAAPGFVLWTDFGPGTDGGFIVGKAQKSGGQELAPSSTNNTPGELISPWLFGGNYGTFSTDPGGEQNIFSDTSCTGAACIGQTELKYFHFAWNGIKLPFGSAGGCTQAQCTPEQLAGIFIREWTYNAQDSTYTLDYSNVVSSGPATFLGLKFRIRLVNNNNHPPVAQNLALTVGADSIAVWQPVVSDPDGDSLTCRLERLPTHGVVTLALDCSGGTYTPSPGYVGPDSFSYYAKDGIFDSNFANVNVTVYSGPAPSPTPTPTPTTRPCEADYPVTRVNSVGKQGTLSVTFTGNIVSLTNKEIKICPDTALSYAAGSTQDVVKCKVKNNLSSGNGMLRIRDHLKCTDKPAGKDKIQFKVKSGITK